MATNMMNSIDHHGHHSANGTTERVKMRYTVVPFLDKPIEECPVDKVTVYLDKAEITRKVQGRLREGRNEVVVTKVSPSIEKDSIRVEAKGPATILEVIFQVKPLSGEEDEYENKYHELSDRLHDLQRNRDALSARRGRLIKQRTVLDGFADNLLKSPADAKESETDDKSSTPKIQIPGNFDGNLLEGMVGFFELYEKQATRLDDSLHHLCIEMEKLEENIKKTEKELKIAENYKDEHMAREVVILMEAAEDGDVEINLSYVVTKAKWTPRYDIRVFSGDSRMKIIYYGMIQQATGEDWDDAKITLSTASPSVGGTVPDLGTQRLFFKPK